MPPPSEAVTIYVVPVEGWIITFWKIVLFHLGSGTQPFWSKFSNDPGLKSAKPVFRVYFGSLIFFRVVWEWNSINLMCRKFLDNLISIFIWNQSFWSNFRHDLYSWEVCLVLRFFFRCSNANKVRNTVLYSVRWYLSPTGLLLYCPCCVHVYLELYPLYQHCFQRWCGFSLPPPICTRSVHVHGHGPQLLLKHWQDLLHPDARWYNCKNAQSSELDTEN